ncbi:hypothetical protein [Hymenobacter terricola]|uniref:hypothetical protein n=1 Tax=Hymenobacter terricola TaxID=2819236 RepID=UPI001B30EB08|nr:hypothetical protein [Hymenobacter terricola]
MIRLATAAGDLDLPGLTLSLDVSNPYFQTDAIPGTTTLPIDVPWSKPNLVALNFPDRYRGPGGPPPVGAQLYVDGVLYRVGKLVYLAANTKARTFSYTFVADAADLATDIRDVLISDLDLGTVPLVRTNLSPAYVLAPVRNAAFFDDKNPAYLSHVLNYYVNGAFPVGAGYPLAPLPYLVPVLRKVLGHFGWTITGPWVDDPEIQQVVLYSDRVLDAAATDVVLSQHVPTISVGALLLGTQNAFCLGYGFNPVRRELRITALRDVAAAARAGYVDRVGTKQKSTPNDTNGFLLRLAPDTEDELDKTLDVGWQQLRVGAGGELLESLAGSLHQVRAVDELVAGRTWLLPALEAKGASLPDDESRIGLRLLLYRGLQPDSQGHAYPLASREAENLAGTSVGNYALSWAGPKGLYQAWHQPWLDFRSRAVASEYLTQFRVADLLALDPGTAERVDEHLHFWEKITLSLSADRRLRQATVTYRELL